MYFYKIYNSTGVLKSITICDKISAVVCCVKVKIEYVVYGKTQEDP
jgi:hypothetical protein